MEYEAKSLSLEALSASSIRDAFLAGSIGLQEAHRRLMEWRSFETWGYYEDTAPDCDKKYLYGKQPKRGSKTYYERKMKDKKISALLSLGYILGEEFPLIEDGKTHFLMLTLTKKADLHSMDDLIEWNSKGCSREYRLFNKRFRNKYGQDVQFSRFDEAHDNGFIHVHLLVYSPAYVFNVYEHCSRKHKDRYGNPIKTWRLKDYSEKRSISSMHVNENPDENFVDVLAFPDMKHFVEYGLKYQLKCFRDEKVDSKREWTLSILTLFDKRALSISKQFLIGVFDYCVARTRGSIQFDLITIESNCLNSKSKYVSDDDKSSVYSFLGSGTTEMLSEVDGLKQEVWRTSFRSSIPPPNIRTELAKNDFSVFQKKWFGKDFFKGGASFVLISSVDELRDIAKELHTVSMIAIDTETTGVDTGADSLVGLSISYGRGQGFYVPVGHNEGNLPIDEVIRCLNPIFLDRDIVKVFHNASFDISFLHRSGFEVEVSNIFDTMVAVHSIDSSKKFMKLDVLAKALFDYDMMPIEELIGYKKREQKGFETLSPEDSYWYAVEDACVTYMLADFFKPYIYGMDIEESFLRDMSLIPINLLMGNTPKRVDVESIKVLRNDIVLRADELKQMIFDCVGYELNLSSPIQLGELFFSLLGLPVINYTDSGKPKVDTFVLKVLSEKHFIVPLIKEYKDCIKRLSFLKALESKSIDGSVYGDFHIISTETGRFSCSNPNLQQMPNDDDFRGLFLPSDDNHVIIKADYSQMELRMLAHVTQDKNLLDCYRNDVDVHLKTAKGIFGDDVPENGRNIAKGVNFGVVYGQTAQGLSASLFEKANVEVSREDSQRFINAFFKTYVSVEPVFNEYIGLAMRDSHLLTLFGSRRWFPFIHFVVGNEARSERRKARNFIIQGSCADILKMAMVDINRKLREKGLESKLLMTVHDELVFDVPLNEVDVMKSLIKDSMENVVSLSVPLVVDIMVSKSWSKSDMLEVV